MENKKFKVTVYSCGSVYTSLSYFVNSCGRGIDNEAEVVNVIRKENPLELRSRTTGRGVYIPYRKIDKIEVEGGEL